MLDPWEKTVGVAHVAVRRFGRKYFRNGDLAETFFDALGMALPSGLVSINPLNTSFDASTVEFMRLLNIHIMDMPAEIGNRFRVRMVEALQRLSARNAPILPAKFLQHIDQVFSPSNERIVERYFAGRTDRLFPAFDASAYDPVVELTPSRAVELALHLLLDPIKMENLEKPQAAADGALSEPGRREGQRIRRLARRTKKSQPEAGGDGTCGEAQGGNATPEQDEKRRARRIARAARKSGA